MVRWIGAHHPTNHRLCNGQNKPENWEPGPQSATWMGGKIARDLISSRGWSTVHSMQINRAFSVHHHHHPLRATTRWQSDRISNGQEGGWFMGAVSWIPFPVSPSYILLYLRIHYFRWDIAEADNDFCDCCWCWLLGGQFWIEFGLMNQWIQVYVGDCGLIQISSPINM